MILVIGATGFIGSHLMCHLAKKIFFLLQCIDKNSNKDKIASLFKSIY